MPVIVLPSLKAALKLNFNSPGKGGVHTVDMDVLSPLPPRIHLEFPTAQYFRYARLMDVEISIQGVGD